MCVVTRVSSDVFHIVKMVGLNSEIVHAVVIFVNIYVEPVAGRRLYVLANLQTDEGKHDIAGRRIGVSALKLCHTEDLFERRIVQQIQVSAVRTA